MKEEFDRLYNKLDTIDNKLDNHLERLSKAEESILWIRGHVKIVTTLGITLASAMAGIIFKFISGE